MHLRSPPLQAALLTSGEAVRFLLPEAHPESLKIEGGYADGTREPSLGFQVVILVLLVGTHMLEQQRLNRKCWFLININFSELRAGRKR